MTAESVVDPSAQAGSREVVEDRVDLSRLDLPRRPEPPVEPVRQLVAVSRALDDERERRPAQLTQPASRKVYVRGPHL